MSERIQITLEPEVQKRAQARAAELGISFVEYIRRLVENDLGARKRRANVSALFDLGASVEGTDVACDKDKMIAAAVQQDHRKGTRGL